MSAGQTDRIHPDELLAGIELHLRTGVIPYRHERAPDLMHGGYLPCSEKYLNTQVEFSWLLHRSTPAPTTLNKTLGAPMMTKFND